LPREEAKEKAKKEEKDEVIDTSSNKNYDFRNMISTICDQITIQLDEWVTEMAKKCKGLLHYKDSYKQELKESFCKF
jgi:acetyl-CoA carboxylase carboxyltransferase component